MPYIIELRLWARIGKLKSSSITYTDSNILSQYIVTAYYTVLHSITGSTKRIMNN